MHFLKVTLLSLTCIFITFTDLHPQVYAFDSPLAHTYSIVARDPQTGELAVAVQSHWFSVGSKVSWAKAGVGVIATQSFLDPSYGYRGLELLEQGKSPQEALDEMLAQDPGREVRQVAILDAQGRVAVHTGRKCIQHAGHASGGNYSVQANMMLNPTVWPAMATAFEQLDSLPLAERVLQTLKAAESQGGDIRGRQSAVLMVVKGLQSDQPWNDELINLQVADHQTPLEELERLLEVFRAYEYMNKGDQAVETGEMELASQHYGNAQKMIPDNLEMKYWHAITLANNQQYQEARTMLAPIFKVEPQWKLLTQRLPEVGILTIPEEELQKILALP